MNFVQLIDLMSYDAVLQTCFLLFFGLFAVSLYMFVLVFIHLIASCIVASTVNMVTAFKSLVGATLRHL